MTTLVIGLILMLNMAFTQNTITNEIAAVGFYNLENLFDTIDNPNVRDWEYTPQGKKKWDSKKYFEKLTNLSTVIHDMALGKTNNGLAILGVAEVENRNVLEDLVSQPKIKNRHYNIVHYDSPDKRGIDVALLYQPSFFLVTNSKSYGLTLTGDSKQFTRDQLVVSGKLLGEAVHIIVAHWPSRYGGQSASEGKRIAAAKVSRHIIDSLFKKDGEAKILLMGDFNDDPVDKSIKNYIGAKTRASKMQQKMLFNPMYDLFKLGIGSLAWGGIWNLFDQVMVSSAFLESDTTKLTFQQATVFKKPYMVQNEGKYKGYPKRTTAGSKHLGGYSDHFPVYITLRKYAP